MSAPEAPQRQLSNGRFAALCERLALADAGATFERLAEAYALPDRHYHNATHISACLHHLDAVRGQLSDPDEVELALWFHDAVYAPGKPGNERKSADWLIAFAAQHGADKALVSRLEALVMVTVHPSVPATAAEGWLVDIDLAILGAPATAYARFERAIRREYAFVPESVFRVRRRSLLQGFLDAPCIYHSRHFQTHLDQRARHNLRTAIAALDG